MNAAVSDTFDRIAHRYAWRGPKPKAANDTRHGILCSCPVCEHGGKPAA